MAEMSPALRTALDKAAVSTTNLFTQNEIYNDVRNGVVAIDNKGEIRRRLYDIGVFNEPIAGHEKAEYARRLGIIKKSFETFLEKNLASGKTEAQELQRLSTISREQDPVIELLKENNRIAMAKQIKNGGSDKVLNVDDRKLDEFNFGDLDTKPLNPLPEKYFKTTPGKSGSLQLDGDVKKVAGLDSQRVAPDVKVAAAKKTVTANLSV